LLFQGQEEKPGCTDVELVLTSLPTGKFGQERRNEAEVLFRWACRSILGAQSRRLESALLTMPPSLCLFATVLC